MVLTETQKLLNSFREWAKTAFTDSYKREVEEYLSQSIDCGDLENRIKLLKIRGLF